ncbi:MAG: hypothetical protein KJZ58_10110 [Flavobacteriales bacterium]|nr:hypothetical protein [Flavobacteriales bacterium]
MANVSVLVSGGTSVLDAIAVILLGLETIRIRKGGGYDPSPDSTSPLRQFAVIEWSEMKRSKLLGVLILLSSVLVERPLTFEWMIPVVFGIVGIELICAFLREATLRSPKFGWISMAIMALLFMWSMACSMDHIAAYAMNTSRFWVISWTVVFTHWPHTAIILIGSTLAILGLLRAHPKKDERLTKPRPWLFA